MPDTVESGPLEQTSEASPHSDAERLRRFCHSVLAVLDTTGPGVACTPALPRELARIIEAGVESIANTVRHEANTLAEALAHLRSLPTQFLNLAPALAELETALTLAEQVAHTLDAFRTGEVVSPIFTKTPEHHESVLAPAPPPDTPEGSGGEAPVDADTRAAEPTGDRYTERVDAHDPFRSLDLDEIRHKQEVRDTDEELKEAAATSTPTTGSSETLLPEPLAFLESVAPVETAVSDSPTVHADDTPPDESSIDPSDSRHAARLFLEGERHHKRHNLESAEELYTHAVRIDPRFGSAYTRRGQIRLAHGEIEEALSDFNRSIQLDKTAVEAFWWRGDAHALAGDLDAAVSDYTRALTLQPDLVRARFNLAVALRQKGETGRALTEFSRVLRVQPNNAKAYLKRGEVHLNLGNHKLAEADLQTVLKLDPDCEQAQQLLLDLPPEANPSENAPTAATTEAVSPVAPKSSTKLPESAKAATGLPASPKSSSSLSRTTGPSTKAGYIAVNCPSCGKLGEVAWDRLSRVFSCAGCSKRFVVKSGGEAVEVVSDNKGGWIEAETVREQAKRKWHRRRTVATFFFLLVILPVSLIGGYKVLQANTPSTVERELPKDLNARAELFGQAWMCGDIRLIQRLTSPAFTKKAFGWYTRHRPPTILRPTATSVPPEGIEGAKVEVSTRPGKSGMMVTIRVSNTKLAPDRPPTELTLAWEERDDHNWYFLP